MDPTSEDLRSRPICSLLLFVATPSEEEALREQAAELGLDFRRDPALSKQLGERGLSDKVGMAFGIARVAQDLGDVLVSTSVVPYDNRVVRPSDREPGYFHDYSEVVPAPARSSLIDRCRREFRRTKFEFNVHFGAILSGAARIYCARFRDELFNTAPHGDDPIVGGEMEGVGLLAAAVRAGDPAWCVVKGISDFADEQRGDDIMRGQAIAPRNAARFVLSGLVNDARDLENGEGP